MPDHTGLPQDHAKSSPQKRWAMGDPLKGDKGTVLLTHFVPKSVRRTVPLSPRFYYSVLIASTRRGKKPPGFSVAAMWYNEAEDWLSQARK